MKGKKLPSSDAAAKIAEELIKAPREKANALPTLISCLSSKKHQVLPIIQSLKIYFVGCFEREELNLAKHASDERSPEAIYSNWLHRHYLNCVQVLLNLISSGTDARTQVAALSLLMDCVSGERLGAFQNELFSNIVTVAVTQQGVAPEVIGALLTKYAEHVDVRFYLLKTLKKICDTRAARGAVMGENGSDDEYDDDQPTTTSRKKHSKKQQTAANTKTSNKNDTNIKEQPSTTNEVSPHDLARTIHDILTQLPPLESTDTDTIESMPSWCGASEFGMVQAADDAIGARQRKKRRLQQQTNNNNTAVATAKWASIKLQKRVLSDTWFSFLRLSLPEDVYKKVLSQLPDSILPHLFNPLLLSDFLTHSLDQGGLIGMLALNGIFLLVTRYGLEYPKFYERLYNLLTPDAFQARYRAKFFQLADIFLASGMVPAYSAASFAKRFARLALTAPPGGALVCIAFIHNIIRRHPACMQLLHRPPQSTTGGDNTETLSSVYKGEDVYDPNEPDPAASRALESSLWEITALKQHANPLVSSFCSTLDKNLTDRKMTSEVDIGDLLTSTYTSLFTKEVERRLKQAPTAFYAEPPVTLFESNPDFPGWARAS